MRVSTERRLVFRRAGAGALVFALAGFGAGALASAQDGTLRVRESALNDFAAAVQPLTLSRNFSFTLWVPNPFLFPPVVPIPFFCNASASVTGIVFDITPASVTARGNVNGAVCGIPYQSTLFASFTVSLDPAGRSLRIVPNSMQMTPTVNVLGFRITAPFAVNVAPSLTASMPVGATKFEIETPAGPRSLVLVGRNLQISRFDGYFEIRGDADFR